MLTSINSSIPGDRNVIFVGHSVCHDLRILSNLGFDFQEMQVSACLIPAEYVLKSFLPGA